MPFLDGATLDASVEQLDEWLVDGLSDCAWAVRDVVVRSLASYMRTSMEDEHEEFLASALDQLLGLRGAGVRVSGVPRHVFLTKA